jgi:hypothetical protein
LFCYIVQVIKNTPLLHASWRHKASGEEEEDHDIDTQDMDEAADIRMISNVSGVGKFSSTFDPRSFDWGRLMGGHFLWCNTMFYSVSQCAWSTTNALKHADTQTDILTRIER